MPQITIVGDKTNGYVVFDAAKGVVYGLDPKTFALGQASTIQLPTSDKSPAAPAVNPKAPAAPSVTPPATSSTRPAVTPAATTPPATASAPAVGVTGNSKNGVVYYTGLSVFYLTDIGNSQAKWKALPDAPFDPAVGIQGICGDLVNGIVIHDGDNIAQIKDVFNNPVWQATAVSPRIPISGIAGDGSNGIVVYRNLSSTLEKYDGDGKFVPSVYKFTGQPYGSPVSQQEPQIQIQALMGDGNSGYLAFGENQLFSLDPVKGSWTRQASSLGFSLNSFAGNPKDGLVAIIGADNFVVATTDFKAWSLVQAIPGTPAASPVNPSAAVSPSASSASAASSSSAASPSSSSASAASSSAAASPASSSASSVSSSAAASPSASAAPAVSAPAEIIELVTIDITA